MATRAKYRKLQPDWRDTGREEVEKLFSDENIAKLRAEGDTEFADSLKSQQKRFLESSNPSPERKAKIAALQIRMIQLEHAIETIQPLTDESE